MTKPNFFIVGAPRCGTTSMYEYLRAHPEIYMPEHAKEPNYFATDFEGEVFSRFRKNEESYLSIFKEGKGFKRVGEASVHYLQSKLSAREIYEFNPDAKIIIMLRNPLDMLQSYHQRLLYSTCENIDNFIEALDAEPDRRQGKRIPSTLYIMPEALYYSDVIKFAEQIERYIDVFGHSNVHIIIYDDFRNNVAKVYQSVLEFLEVDNTDFQPEFTANNVNKRARNQIMSRLLTNKYLIRIGDQVPAISMPIYRMLRRINTKNFKREPLSTEQRYRLATRFRPEIERLNELLELDLDWCQE